MFINNLIEKPSYFFSVVLITLFSIITHELAHGLAAISQGDQTPRQAGHMTLNPIKHMGWLGIIFLFMFGIAWGAMPVNPANFKYKNFSQILVSFAGPFSNLILGTAFTYLYSTYIFDPTGEGLASKVLLFGALINFVLFLFNLIPLPPLDGFKVAEALFPPLQALGTNPQIAFVLLIVLFNIPIFWKNLYKIAELMMVWLMKTCL